MSYNFNMKIREAKESDIEQIISLQSQIYRVDSTSPNSNQTLQNQLKDESCKILVGVEDGPPSRAGEAGKVIATGVIYLIQVPIRGVPYAFLEGIVVDESLRGKGLGTEFFKEILAVCKHLNCYKILFTSGADREDAHRFYEKLGFKKWGLEFRMDL